MKIYMDVCCLNRPFDDLTQDRVQFESDAVLAIISHCNSGEWALVSSEIVDLELRKLTNADKLRKIRALCSSAVERFRLSAQGAQRAEVL
jgi:hypothetical protein